MLTRTTTRLLDELRDPAHAEAWQRFDARYRPALRAFALRLGFDREEAAELAQQALTDFVQAFLAGRYERQQGRLSSWLIGIARNVGSGMRRKRRAGPLAGGSQMADLPDEATLTGVWAREWEHAILVEAIGQLRATTRVNDASFTAFELVALNGMPPAEAAAQCGMSVDAVYLAKSRLTKRLRGIVSELTATYDAGA